MSASVPDEIEGGRAGTGVRGCKGDRGAAVVGAKIEAGIVLIRSLDDEDPLGLKIDVSKERSGPSCKAMDRIEGEGAKIDDSYDASVAVAHG